MCNDIGEASYVDSLVAAAFLGTVRKLPSGAAISRRVTDRYKLGFEGVRAPRWRAGAAPWGVQQPRGVAAGTLPYRPLHAIRDN
mgnify:CR=1 FL=1